MNPIDVKIEEEMDKPNLIAILKTLSHPLHNIYHLKVYNSL